MSKVRGKDPLPVSYLKEVHVNSYTQKITIHAVGFDGTRDFTIEASLAPHCARNLILDLRRGLRQIRKETADRLNNCVTEAEKELP